MTPDDIKKSREIASRYHTNGQRIGTCLIEALDEVERLQGSNFQFENDANVSRYNLELCKKDLIASNLQYQEIVEKWALHEKNTFVDVPKLHAVVEAAKIVSEDLLKAGFTLANKKLFEALRALEEK